VKSLVRSSEPLDNRSLQHLVPELLVVLLHLLQVRNSANFCGGGDILQSCQCRHDIASMTDELE
jgi:hypothetical protein